MRKAFFLCTMLFAWAFTNAQYKNDNVTYKTIDPANLCELLKNNPGYLLLDVRSAGEHNDTSRSTGLNIGHLNGAKNIDIRELAKRWREIQDYKDKPVFVYCSHSQRSRRASRLLADSGFTKIYNINGGLTSVYYRGLNTSECFSNLLTTNNAFRGISPNELCKKLTSTAGSSVIIDVRSDSAYRHISTDAQSNASGTIKNSIHIPLEELEQKLASIPSNKEIVLIDVYGDEASRAAALLHTKAYANVSFLVEGVSRLLYLPEGDVACLQRMYLAAPGAKTISTIDFAKKLKAGDGIVVDTRTAEEFNSTHKDMFRNIGRVRNAVNVPYKENATDISTLEAYKNKPVYVYDFSSGNAYRFADLLVQHGFTNVSVLAGGLFNIRWTAANVAGQSQLAELVVDVPEQNR